MKVDGRVVLARCALLVATPLVLLPFLAPAPQGCCEAVDPGVGVAGAAGAFLWSVLLPLVLLHVAVGPARPADGVLVVPTVLGRRRVPLDRVRRVHGSYDATSGYVFLLLRARARWVTVVGEGTVAPAVRKALADVAERDPGVLSPTAEQVRQGLVFERWPAGHRSGRALVAGMAAWIFVGAPALTTGYLGLVLLRG